jgi:hypothetical protein
MKIGPNIYVLPIQKPPEKNVFDLDVQLSRKATDVKIGGQLTLSKSLCTAGCTR